MDISEIDLYLKISGSLNVLGDFRLPIKSKYGQVVGYVSIKYTRMDHRVGTSYISIINKRCICIGDTC